MTQVGGTTLDILLVEDDAEVRGHVAAALARYGHRVVPVGKGRAATTLLCARAFDLVISDIQLPDIGGFELLARLRRDWPETDVILITGYGTIPDAIAATRANVAAYLTKPLDGSSLLDAVERVAVQRSLRDALRPAGASGHASSGLVGRSPQIAALARRIDAIADSDAGVLILGESGTGKELVARTLHERSRRRDRPFVALNCAALPESLVEAELFGHERGAFTGAVRSREGRFKAADGGTLFLDEVNELPLAVQPKLLRVLQGGVFEPVGTNEAVAVDARVVTASNRDLRALVAAGRFREDLYYRINVFEIRVPPLRERAGDVLHLVRHFLQLHARGGEEPSRLSPEAWAALEQYSFPGNVRELAHAIEHGIVLSRGGEIGLHHLPPAIAGMVEREPGPERPLAPLGDALRAFERQYLLRALDRCRGNRTLAARTLGISRKSLWQKMRLHGISNAEIAGRPGREER